MSGPPRVNFRPFYRCWWGEVRRDPALRARRLAGHCTLNQFVVLATGGLSPRAGEATGKLAVVLDAHFHAYLGAARPRVYAALERGLRGAADGGVPVGRRALLLATEAVNLTLNQLLLAGDLPAGLPEPRP